jgi:hypothetical protein
MTIPGTSGKRCQIRRLSGALRVATSFADAGWPTGLSDALAGEASLTDRRPRSRDHNLGCLLNFDLDGDSSRIHLPALSDENVPRPDRAAKLGLDTGDPRGVAATKRACDVAHHEAQGAEAMEDWPLFEADLARELGIGVQGVVIAG